jgi:hypothetical protein
LYDRQKLLTMNSSSTQSFLEAVFGLLHNNKRFPYYQAERRIDIFINFFIEDIIRQHTMFRDAIYVAAEFPLKKGETDHAAHVDYLMYSKEYKRALFIELKTDDKSYEEDQIIRYASEEGFLKWYEKMLDIKMNGYKEKKQYLIHQIQILIGAITEDLLVETIILKPTVDMHPKDAKRHFIALKGLDVNTAFHDEWLVLKNNVLNEL